jgi:nucleotide-binding universal stress UspA family protein
MSYAVILGIIEGASGREAAVENAVRLGRAFKSRVDLLHVELDTESMPPLMGEGMSSAAVEQIFQKLHAEAEARRVEVRHFFDRYSEIHDLPVVAPDTVPVAGKFEVSFLQFTGRLTEEVMRRARLSDVTVFGRPEPESESELSAIFETILFESGRPLLLAPSMSIKALESTAAVAWDRSREAARAVQAALPILRQAKRVVVITARQSGSDVVPSELAHYLAGHGIDARTWAFTPESGDLGREILQEAAKAEADLLIMGGYGHSRLRELVLGGTTRSVLSKAEIPVFMMH